MNHKPHGQRVVFLSVLLSVLCGLAGCDPPDEVLGPQQQPVSILPDGVTFQAGDGRRFFCEVEITGWGVPVGTLVPLAFVPGQFYAGQTHPPDASSLAPYITFDPIKLNNMPVPPQIFLVAHECGHVNSGVYLSEVDANCWGARRIRAQGILTEAEWDVVRNFLITAYPSGTGPYPSGADQWTLMQDPFCFP